MKQPIFIEPGKTKLVAHRGLSAIERENTMPAFIAAANRPYYGIETDVHITADGKFVCIHNHDTEFMSGDKLSVEETSFDTLRSLKLKDFDGSRGRIDLRIPTLAEYISVCHDYGKQSILELKGRFPKEKLSEVIGIIKDIGHLEGTTFIAFDLNNLIYLRELLPEQSAQFLISSFPDDLIDTLKAHRLDLDIHYKALTAENVALLHENGIVINTWTVDDPAKAEELISWGVDQITSNRLAPLN
ncbi:MAG: hypothetical protein IKB34_00615 [Clostridia bacterium]|nr:hypothetical protein [Clostridia bacterium]